MSHNAAVAWQCSACGATFGESFDACGSCGSWGGAIPAIGVDVPRGRSRRVLLADAKVRPVVRMNVAEPWQTALGGGLAKKSTILVWGSAKAGKTTEALRLAASVPGALFIPCEPGQDTDFLANLARRDGLDMSGLYVAEDCHTLADVLEALTEPPAPTLAIVDSLSELGGLEAWRELRAAFPSHPLMCIMHTTKNDKMAGENKLKHAADTIVRITRKHVVVSENRYAAGPGVVRVLRNG